MRERCGMRPFANGVKCGVVEWVKKNTSRWLSNFERKKNEEFEENI